MDFSHRFRVFQFVRFDVKGDLLLVKSVSYVSERGHAKEIHFVEEPLADSSMISRWREIGDLQDILLQLNRRMFLGVSQFLKDSEELRVSAEAKLRSSATRRLSKEFGVPVKNLQILTQAEDQFYQQILAAKKIRDALSRWFLNNGFPLPSIPDIRTVETGASSSAKGTRDEHASIEKAVEWAAEKYIRLHEPKLLRDVGKDKPLAREAIRLFLPDLPDGAKKEKLAERLRGGIQRKVKERIKQRKSLK